MTDVSNIIYSADATYVKDIIISDEIVNSYVTAYAEWFRSMKYTTTEFPFNGGYSTSVPFASNELSLTATATDNVQLDNAAIQYQLKAMTHQQVPMAFEVSDKAVLEGRHFSIIDDAMKRYARAFANTENEYIYDTISAAATDSTTVSGTTTTTLVVQAADLDSALAILATNGAPKPWFIGLSPTALRRIAPDLRNKSTKGDLADDILLGLKPDGNIPGLFGRYEAGVYVMEIPQVDLNTGVLYNNVVYSQAAVGYVSAAEPYLREVSGSAASRRFVLNAIFGAAVLNPNWMVKLVG